MKTLVQTTDSAGYPGGYFDPDEVVAILPLLETPRPGAMRRVKGSMVYLKGYTEPLVTSQSPDGLARLVVNGEPE